MTEFLRNLSLTRRNWRLVGLDILNADDEDPVCAVAGIDGVTVQPWLPSVLAATGLTYDEALAVSAASFADGWHDKDLRLKLLEACGL